MVIFMVLTQIKETKAWLTLDSSVAAVPGYAMLSVFVLVHVTLALMMYKVCMIKLWCIQANIIVMAYFG